MSKILEINIKNIPGSFGWVKLEAIKIKSNL